MRGGVDCDTCPVTRRHMHARRGPRWCRCCLCDDYSDEQRTAQQTYSLTDEQQAAVAQAGVYHVYTKKQDGTESSSSELEGPGRFMLSNPCVVDTTATSRKGAQKHRASGIYLTLRGSSCAFKREWRAARAGRAISRRACYDGAAHTHPVPRRAVTACGPC